MDQLDEAGHAPIGLYSIGVDGERLDTISGALKPPLRPPVGAFLVTAEEALKRSSASLSLVERLPVRSLLGPLFVARVASAGDVLLAGIRHRKDALLAKRALLAQGATRLLLDGALDRRLAAHPALVDHVVLCTGYALAADVATLCAQTASALERLRLPAARPPHDAAQLDHWLPGRIPPAESLERSALRLRGALTDEAARRLLALRSAPALWVPSPAHLLCSDSALRSLLLHLPSLSVEAKPQLLALVVNPYAADRGMLPRALLLDALRDVAAPTPCVDVTLAPLPLP